MQLNSPPTRGLNFSTQTRQRSFLDYPLPPQYYSRTMPPITRSMVRLSCIPEMRKAILGLPSLADLPIEVRLQIYGEMDEARMVEMHYSDDLTEVWSTTKPPIGLSICRETRQHALEHYELRFCGSNNECRTYFDITRDIVYFGMFHLLGSVCPSPLVSFFTVKILPEYRQCLRSMPYGN